MRAYILLGILAALLAVSAEANAGFWSDFWQAIAYSLPFDSFRWTW